VTVISRDAIERLYLDHTSAVDEDIERWPGLFTDDCSYRITSR
jgi:3-phenylpropionate/cinnamic acid dioxygenase small subunit